MMLTCLGFAFFAGVGGARLAQKFHPRGIPATILCVGLLLGYAHPILLGEMFPTFEQRKTLQPLQFKAPDYAQKAIQWLNTQSPDERIFFLPSRGVWSTDWGYGGMVPYLWYQIPQPLVYNQDPLFQMVSQGVGRQGLEMIRWVHDAFSVDRGEISPRLDRLLRLLGVRYLLHETDFRYDHLPLPDSIDQMSKRIEQQKGIKPGPSIGAWDFYEINNPFPLWSIWNRVVVAWGNPRDVVHMAQTQLLDGPPVVWINQNSENLFEELNSQGLVQEMVWVNPQNGAEQIAGSESIPLTVLLSSRQEKEYDGLEPASDVQLVGHGVQWQWAEGVKAVEEWQRILPGNAASITIHNPHARTIPAVLRFEIQAYQKPRVLYPMLNDQPVLVDSKHIDTTLPVGTDPQWVLIPALHLKPGDNQFRFYTTETWVKESGQRVSFAVRNLSIGDPVIHRTIQLPRDGSFDIRLYPQFHGRFHPQAKSRTILINGNKVPLKAVQDRVGLWVWQGQVMLKKGQVEVVAEDNLGEGWVLELRSGARANDKMLAQRPKVVSPSSTKHKVDFHLTAPGILVFNEAYDTGWTLADFPHLRANGFANAWVLPKGDHQQLVKFAPQKWARLGQKISLVGSCGVLLLCMGTFVGRFKRKRNSVESGKSI